MPSGGGLRRGSALAPAAAVVLALAGCRPDGGSAVGQEAVEPRQAVATSAELCPAAVGAGWTGRDRPRRYIGQDLFNHIDGAAEVFLEVGFREAAVQRYSDGQFGLTLEIYEMSGPTAARAIYLRSRGRGAAVEGVAGRNVGNRYQITAQKGRYYVQVTNAAGEERCLPTMVQLANAVLGAIGGDEPVALLDLLPTAGLVAGSEVIVCGPYTLQSVFTFGEGDILQLQGKHCGIAGDYRTEAEGSFTRLIIPYEDAEAARAALAYVGQHLDSQLERVTADDRHLIFRDQQGRRGVVALDGDRLDIRLGLTEGVVSLSPEARAGEHQESGDRR